MKNIYLDYSATTPLSTEAEKEIIKVQSDLFGNPSSIHWFGRRAKVYLEECREILASHLSAKATELVFTSGGTEANATAITGVFFAQRLKGKNHIIVSAVEHHSVLHTVKFLQTFGAEITILPITKNGLVTTDALQNAINEKTCLISIMYVNNETGSVQRLNELIDIANKYSVPLHTDAVQAAGKIELNLKNIPVDLMSISAHKFYGPKGCGVLFVREGTEFIPLLHGGSQEINRRAGTENLPAIAGCTKAFTEAVKNLENDYKYIAELNDYFKAELKSNFDHLIVNSPDNSIPHILNVSFDPDIYNTDGETLIMGLDIEGIAVSSGSACASGSIKPSHVISALGYNEKVAKATLRFSFGKYTTKEELSYTINVLRKLIKKKH